MQYNMRYLGLLSCFMLCACWQNLNQILVEEMEPALQEESVGPLVLEDPSPSSDPMQGAMLASKPSMRPIAKTFLQTINLERITQDHVDALVKHYGVKGRGGIKIMMIYDPASEYFLPSLAAEQAKRLKQAFAQQSINDVEYAVLPRDDMGEKVEVVFSYSYYDAEQGDGCGNTRGFYGDTHVIQQRDYDGSGGKACAFDHAVTQEEKPKPMIHQMFPEFFMKKSNH